MAQLSRAWRMALSMIAEKTQAGLGALRFDTGRSTAGVPAHAGRGPAGERDATGPPQGTTWFGQLAPKARPQ
jgi:hypothetical protein